MTAATPNGPHRLPPEARSAAGPASHPRTDPGTGVAPLATHTSHPARIATPGPPGARKHGGTTGALSDHHPASLTGRATIPASADPRR